MKLPKKIILLYLAAGVAVGHLSVLFIPKAAEATDYIFGSNQADGFFIRGRVTEGPTPTPIFKIDTNTGRISFGSVSADRVSAGSFGNAIGGGDYSFPANLTITNGNVGIGTTAPGEKLDVNGAIYALSTAIKLTYDSDLQRNALLFWGDGAVSTRNNGSIYINPNGTGNTLITNGNVGIGTTAPGNLLHLYGTASSTGISVQRNNASCGAYLNLYNTDLATDGWTIKNSLLGCGNLGDLYFGEKGINGNERFTLKAGGNVGIGTTAPAELLTLSSTTPKLFITDSDTGDNNELIKLQGNSSSYYSKLGTYNLEFIRGTATSVDAVIGINSDTGGAFSGSGGDIHFKTNNAGTYAERLSILKSGNVGIGTAGPGTKLHVRVDGDGANEVLRLTSILTNWTAGYGPRLLFNGGNDDRVYGAIGAFLQTTGNGGYTYMTFSTRDSETVGERVRITSNGNVGIGTTGPGYKLDVVGRVNADAQSGSGGYISTGDYGGTGTAAYFPSGIWSNGGNAWIYGNVRLNNQLIIDGNTVIDDGGGWHRSYGNTGWYNGSWGGGWYMTDSTWIRTYNSKSVWTNTGYLGSQGGLTIGYSGAAPPSNGAIIAGNVGIGTTSPESKLTVTNYNSYATAIYASSAADTSSTTGVYGYSPNHIGTRGHSDSFAGVYGSSNSGYDFYGSGPKSYFVKVGINTQPNSTDNLHIYETDANERSLRMGSGGAFSGAVRSIFFVPNLDSGGYNWLSAAGDSGLFWSASGIGTGNFVIAPWSSSGAGIRITSSGYVGIGVQSPGYQLDVWSTSVRGYGAYINRASHSSLKDRYTDVSVLDKIAKLNIKEWQYKDEVAKKNKDKGRHLYPFADDFYKIFNLGDSEYQIRAEDVAGVALKGVQELNSFLNLKSISDLEIKNLNFEFKLTHKKDNSFIDRIGAFAEIIVAKIKAGLIEAKKIVVDQLFIGNIDVGKKLQELSDQVNKQQETINAQQKEIEGLKEEIKKLKNN